ncbi:hypothetical protein [Bacillus phage SWEP1]|nr:hypothetical protein [Bacillus phage SWEP1]
MTQMKDTRTDIIAGTLDCYRERTVANDTSTPLSYTLIREKIRNIIKKDKKVLLEIKDSYSTQTVIIQFEKAYDRWAMGTSICYFEGEELRVPYTVHYSDILCKKIGVKTILEGMRPID